MTSPQPADYELAYAIGPDGHLWLSATDVTSYMRDTAEYIRTNEDLDETARNLTAAYMHALAASFAGAAGESDDTEEEDVD